MFLPRESHGQRSLAGFSPCGPSQRVGTTERLSTVPQVSQLIWLCSPPAPGLRALSLCHPPHPHLPSFPFPSICLPSFLLILLFCYFAILILPSPRTFYKGWRLLNDITFNLQSALQMHGSDVKPWDTYWLYCTILYQRLEHPRDILGDRILEPIPCQIQRDNCVLFWEVEFATAFKVFVIRRVKGAQLSSFSEIATDPLWRPSWPKTLGPKAGGKCFDFFCRGKV